MRRWLRDDFDYDLWANREWAPVVMTGPFAREWETLGEDGPSDDVPTEPRARAANVFIHLLWGQRLWLRMCGEDVRSQDVPGRGEAWMEALHAAWIAQIERREPEETVVTTSPAGEPRARPFRDVVRQVTNHGTYHRGGLREIAETAGLAFPETDFTRWRNATAPLRADA